MIILFLLLPQSKTEGLIGQMGVRSLGMIQVIGSGLGQMTSTQQHTPGLVSLQTQVRRHSTDPTGFHLFMFLLLVLGPKGLYIVDVARAEPPLI